MSTHCKSCNGAHYVKPPESPELSMPCPDCNSDWKKPLVTVYTDDSTYPFGNHMGKKFSDIPDDYFLWAIDQRWIKEWPAIERYILENFKDELA